MISINTMIKNINYISIIFFSITLIFLDAYLIFNVPLSWIGLSFLFLVSLYYLIKNNGLKKLNNIFLFLILISIPQFFQFFTVQHGSSDLIYTLLRYFNIVSFVTVFSFSIQIFKDISRINFFKYMKFFILLFSFVSIYIYFAQIFDLFEPVRNRENTNLFGDSSQSTFWLSQPHRAMSTFREPVFLITFFFPIVLSYFYLDKKNQFYFPFFTGIALGLTRSDYVRLFCIVLLCFVIFNYIKSKEVIYSFLSLIFSIMIFSTFGILECNINPQSVDCQDYQEDLKKINDSGKLKVKSNSSNPITELDSDRVEVIEYFITSLSSLEPSGVSQVNLNYQNYLKTKVSENMYFTNRTLPYYLLTRYSTLDFGTGNYSTLKFTPNVQNLVIFYTHAFGYVFPALVFLLIIDLLIKEKFSTKSIFFLMILMFISISPIEEVNAFYGLILGLLYRPLFKEDYESL